MYEPAPDLIATRRDLIALAAPYRSPRRSSQRCRKTLDSPALCGMRAWFPARPRRESDENWPETEYRQSTDFQVDDRHLQRGEISLGGYAL